MKVLNRMSSSLAVLAVLLTLSLAACQPNIVDVETTVAHVRVTVPATDTFRVRLLKKTSDASETESFAVDPAALRASAPFAVDRSNPAFVVVRSASAALRINRDPLQLTLLDATGNVVAQEAAPVIWDDKGALVSWSLPDGEHVYGLGDKANGLDRRGHTFQMWNYDAYGWAPTSDPLYKSIPFLVFVKDGRAHGLFIDNPSRAQVDVGATDPQRFTYHSERATVMDLYLLAGPDPKGVIGAYTTLTGRTPLPPRWALGYHQCRYSYMSEAEAREVASRLRADGIPTDALWLDIDYQDGYAPFTVNTSTFPNFTGMIADFAAAGLNTVLITDPHIKQLTGYAPYDSGLSGDHFIRTPAGGLFTGPVWPQTSVFPEFTLSRTRTWWGGLYRDFVSRGVAGFWNDMNEPAIFVDSKTMPDDTPHRLDDGTTVDHVTAHNVYGLLNARATHEGLLALRPDMRPFVLTRAGYAGSQRWATTWTGDNTASREHMAVTIPQLTNLGVSGYAFAGADVGGFVGCPYSDADPDLMAEWIELGALQPFFRNHAAKDTCRREPWVRGAAVEERIRAGIERRYRLLPYLYTAFEESSRTGLPVIRPLWLEYPTDASAATNDRAYLFGRDLLVAPKLVVGTASYQVTLPAAAWWDTHTGKLVANGGSVTITPPANDSIRIFARAGAIVPSQPVMQGAGEVPQGALTLDVWPGGDCSGALYLDDGQSFDYRKGTLQRIAYACQPSATGIQINASSVGRFDDWWTSTRLVIHGAQQPQSVTIEGGAQLPWYYDYSTQALTVVLDGGKSDWKVAAVWGPFMVNPTTASVVVGDTVQIAATADATWTADNANCTVADGLVTGVSPGICRITATSTADTSKTATSEITVTPFTLTVSPTSASIHVGDPVLLTANRAATWTTSNSNLCTVVDGMVTGVGVGNCTVTATATKDTSKTATCEVTVTARPASNLTANLYVKGNFPNFTTTWGGDYNDMMRLSADYTWSWTWTFPEAVTVPFKLSSPADSWPGATTWGVDTVNHPTIPPGLSGTLYTNDAVGGNADNVIITVEAGTYLFTFHEDTGEYSIEKQ